MFTGGLMAQVHRFSPILAKRLVSSLIAAAVLAVCPQNGPGQSGFSLLTEARAEEPVQYAMKLSEAFEKASDRIMPSVVNISSTTKPKIAKKLNKRDEQFLEQF